MTRAAFETKSAFLFTDFGAEFARKHFTAEQIAQLGVYGPRSKHAGKSKGKVLWTKCTRGGWVSTSRETASGDAQGYAENQVGKTVSVSLAHAEYGQQEVVVVTKDLSARETAKGPTEDRLQQLYALEVGHGLNELFKAYRVAFHQMPSTRLGFSLTLFFAVVRMDQ